MYDYEGVFDRMRNGLCGDVALESGVQSRSRLVNLPAKQISRSNDELPP